MSRLSCSVLCCLVLGGCAWIESDEAEQESVATSRVERIAYTSFRPSGAIEVWIARGDGRGRRRLAEGRAPAVSPDGRWVAFQGGRGDHGFYPDLMLVAAAGGRPRLLLDRAHSSVWSPDSGRVAAVQQLSLRTQALVSIDVDSGARVTLGRGAIYGSSFAPDGRRVAYARAAPRPWGAYAEEVDVYIASADGGGERRLTDDGDSGFPVWGPHEIAFARLVPFRGWGADEIWTVRPDGTAMRLLARTPRPLLVQGVTGLRPAAWSADGRALLAGLANEFGEIPYAVDPRTGIVRRVGDYGYHALPGGLSRDGRFVLASDTGVEVTDATRVEVVPFAGGPGRVIARRAHEASWNR